MDGTAKSQVAAASARLPERQREALELREEGLSYQDVATKLDTTWACVGQLIAHARINLYDEVRGTILASVAPSPDCERAVGLIAAREDGELGERAEAAWLDAHLQDCDRCRRGVEEMREAGRAYRGFAPGATTIGSPPGAAPSPRRRLVLAAAAAALLLFAGMATAVVRDDPASPPVKPPVDVADRSISPARSTAASESGKKAERKKRQPETAGRSAASSDMANDVSAAPVTTAPATSELPAAVPEARPPAGGAGGGSPNRPSGKTAVDPPQRTTAPTPKPAPTAASAPTPSAAPAPEPAVAPPPVEEPSEEPPRRREPPGKPAHAGPE